MAKGIFVHRTDSIYDDSPAEHYQFPRQYLSRVSPCIGDWIIYYEPSKVRDTRGYFAVAKVADVVPDPTAKDMYLALIEPGTYLDFVNPVPFNGPTGLVEQGVLNEAGKISGRAQAAVNRTIPIMSVMMHYAEQLGLRPRGSNPCRGTPRFKRKLVDRFLSAREFNRLATSLREFEQTYPIAVQAIRLLIYTGARHGEVVGLRWEWVQPPRLMLPDSKTGAKIIYLNRQAQAVLNAMPNKTVSGLVFPSVRGDSPVVLSPIWHEIRHHAALPDIRLHDLRHSFASIAIADGISLVVIGKLLGHALAETTERYAHLADEAIADAAKRVSGSLAKCLGIAA